MFDPWKVLHALTHVTLIWAPLIGRYGMTNGRDKIYLHPEQLQVERRCTLTHELVHLERRHTNACHSTVENAVRRETARRLVTLDRLVDAYKWSRSLDEVADECWVTRETLLDRLDHLQPYEAQALADALLARGDCP